MLNDTDFVFMSKFKQGEGILQIYCQHYIVHTKNNFKKLAT